MGLSVTPTMSRILHAQASSTGEAQENGVYRIDTPRQIVLQAAVWLSDLEEIPMRHSTLIAWLEQSQQHVDLFLAVAAYVQTQRHRSTD